MEDDLKAIKKGQSPSGVELQKLPEQSPVVSTGGVKSLVPPPPPSAPRSDIRVELGKTEKAKPLEMSKPSFQLPLTPTPPITLQPGVRVEMGKTEKSKTLETPGVTLPPSPVAPLPQKPMNTQAPSSLVVPTFGSSRSPKKLLLIVAIVLVVAGAGWLGYSLFGDKFASTPTPTPIVIEPTPTPTPVNPIDSIFGANLTSIVVPVGIPAGSDPYAYLKSSIAAQQVDIGRILFYKFTDETGNRYSFPAMLARLVINHPQGLNTTDFKSEMLLSLYGALNGNKNVGLAVPIPTEEGDFGQYRAAMFEWEITMAKDLATLFELNIKKQTGKTFSENLYQGVVVRYLNFPNPDSTIDYAFVATPSGLTFLAIANSRSHIYSIIDQILGF